MKKLWILLFLLLNHFVIMAQNQNIISSKTFINTCYHGHQCFSINNVSYLFYDEASEDFYIQIDFNKFKTENDSIDEWLVDLTDTKLIFKAKLSYTNVLTISKHNTKSITVNGNIYFNKIKHNQPIELTIYGLLNRGINTNENELYGKVNINLQFVISPKDYKINNKVHHLKKPISIAIQGGYLNQLKPGMDYLIKTEN